MAKEYIEIASTIPAAVHDLSAAGTRRSDFSLFPRDPVICTIVAKEIVAAYGNEATQTMKTSSPYTPDKLGIDGAVVHMSSPGVLTDYGGGPA